MGEFKINKYIFSTMSVVAEKGDEVREAREKEISLITAELFLYKVLVKDLVSHFPTYKDRNMILNIAYYIIEENNIFKKFQKIRGIPISTVSRETKISKGFLELWQDYIIAYVLILSNPNYKYIQDYLAVEISEDDTTNIVPYTNNNENVHRGIVFKISKRATIILTSSGQFCKIKKSEDIKLGNEVHGEEKKGLIHYKLHIAIGFLLVLLVGFAIYKDYNTVNSTVVFTSTSQVKMNINKGNKVIYCYSATDRGNEMINEVEPMDKDIDEVLQKLLMYSKENEMVPNDGFLIVITGESLTYGDLENTDEYIVDNNIDIQINNGGSLHNVYESVQIKRKENK